ncbi:PREDICTED: uncharacterized protein LOC105360385 [Ceratosolen solmsi marchali]|uniref:Uncharacterized protein LOC105360385 n=1 Tax=Ceratosolen solmsi marchali TaxID=326594 RepID=A0AAJ6YCN6_9HYME|nr:PREDICTED: uncharacterized protein LOC105360385 [Ceratosolen solmsi marchali]
MLGPNVRMARDREFPFIVALKHINLENPIPNRDHICTAALISRIHVLTAAQCLNNREANETLVLYGTNILIYGVTYSIQWWITYNNWALRGNRNIINLDNDVAVIKLTQEIEGDFEPATLISATNAEMMGQLVQLAGWGTSDRRVLSLNLLTDVAVVVSNAQCEAHISQGDYGGPVLYMNKIIGINKKILPVARREYNHLKINVHTSIQCNFPTVNALIGVEVRSAHVREFPFLVAFKHINVINPHATRDHICTGSLISRSHVLSAEQCIRNRNKNETAILHGTNSLSSCVQYSIEWWITFGEWSNYRNRQVEYDNNDISITKLTHDVQGILQTAILSTVPFVNLVDKSVRFAAWGVNNRRMMSRTILTATARTITNSACEHKISQLTGLRHEITNNYFCTHNSPFTLLKRGDFGGPVLYFNNIIGINKEILPQIANEYNHHKVNVHTSINYYREFIADVTAIFFEWF